MARTLAAFLPFRWLVLVLVLVAVGVSGLPGTGSGGQALAADLQLPGLDADAHAYASGLRAKAPPQPNRALIDEATGQAAAALAAHDQARAVAALERVVAAGDDRATTWMALAQAQTGLIRPNLDRALQAAWLGAGKAAAGKERVDDLIWLARLLDGPLNRPQDAMAAYGAAIDEGKSVRLPLPEAEHRLAELRLVVGLTLKKLSVDSDQYPARLCLEFSDRLKSARDLHFEDFVRLTPAVPVTALADDNQLCLSGLSHGTSYDVTVRQGLPGVDGLVLKQDDTEHVQVQDRSPSVAFRGQSFILVRGDTGDLPVVSVNLDAVGLKLYRINDRNLVSQLKGEHLWGELSDDHLDTLKESEGELVWQGKLAVHGERNKEAVTGIAIRTLIPEPKPGLYVLAAHTVDVTGDQTATQWLMVSDLGLTTTRGADGIHVMVRSLATARPLPGVEVALLARNNAELGRATTDGDGHALFAPGLTRGSGGQAPVMVTAYGHDGDFAALDLTLAAFDLSDRGVGGRAVPGPMDAYLYTDRGVYRPGETVNLTALLRDDRTVAVDNFPLTIKVLRPSGTEFYAATLKPAATGGYALPLALSATAPMGGWSVEAYGDPKADPIGKVAFQVEAFIPERLAVDLTPGQPLIEPGQPFDLLVTSRFLYGAPAAGLGGNADVALEEDPEPYPGFKGYRFGLAQEAVTARIKELVLPAGDAEGKAHLTVDLPPQPDTTKPLRAVIHVAVAEPGGRPSRKTITVPVRSQPYAIGIKGRFADAPLQEGQAASFEVIALDSQGRRLARSDLTWELVAEHHDFKWYYDGGKYSYRVTERDQSVRSGRLSLTAAAPTVQQIGALPYGRYRLEVSDAATGVATSLRFESGWEESASPGDTPDTVEVTADRPAYAAGETAHIHIQPPFGGEVLLTVATDRLHTIRTLSVPKTGTTVDVTVDEAWGPGAYVTATVYRPPVHGKDRLPVRAIGLTWVALETTARTLSVAVDLPEVVRPNQTLDVPLRVTPGSGTLGGAAGPAYVTLAAVDEGILQLTQFVSPDPGQHYFAKRQLGLDLRDDYGRLIDTIDGPTGDLREGGDSGLAAGLPKVPITVVSLFQGPVAVDAAGRATVRLTLPAFNGQLRLMAVAFDRTRLGALSTKLTVRDPLVAEATLPRFLAPGDNSALNLSLHNVEAPAGRYRVTVTGEGPVRVAAADAGAGSGSSPGSSPGPGTVTVVTLGAGVRQELVLPVTADAAGIGGVAVDVAGPLDGAPVVAVHQDLGLTVRPSRPVESEFVVRQLAPGADAAADAALLAGYVPGTAGLALSFSSGPPFDVAGLLAALDRYPYGCLEQVVSRGLPLLAVNTVAQALGTATMPEEARRARVDQAINQVLDKQRYDGAFGLWSSDNEKEPWLTAYAMEFLTRARSLKHPVPDTPYLAGLTWLRRYAIDGGSDSDDLAARAYAFYTLALAGVLTPGPVRYFHDAFIGHLPTPLAKGQIGAALARLGDHDRAEVAFDAAMSELARDYWWKDYGSTVRDSAALVTLLTESGMADRGRLPALIDRLPASAAAVSQTNTQEQAWLVLAADTLMHGAAPLVLTRGGQPLPKADPVRLVPGPAELKAGITVRNAGRQPVWQAVATYGVPTVPKPAAREGFRIKRNFFWRDGTPVNLDAVRQNDVFVVVLEGVADTKLYHQAIVSQPLPAGWEIEKQALGVSGSEVPAWLTGLSEPAVAELRDDRYVASVVLTDQEAQFKLAFAVRAVTPGSYELPGAVLEDMYKPRFFARQAVGRITVRPAGADLGTPSPVAPH
jgi:uncharacterized protein YfaS (alpha-2-macroglobulin family)